MGSDKVRTSKRIKNIVITLIEIIAVAAIIFAILMIVNNRINKDADRIGEVNVGEKNLDDKTDDGDDKYYITINIKKSAVIVYRYANDKKEKTPYKTFRCSVGKSLKEGKYTTSKTYEWLDINGSWHRYNIRLKKDVWIQSEGYSDKYPYTLKKSSYNAIGNAISGSCIVLCAGDAQWIYDNCIEGTTIKVVKGKKSDKLPIEPKPEQKTYKYCGWDPTDPDDQNPYLSADFGHITGGSDVVYVEKGDTPAYLQNIIALNPKGANITGKLQYNEIDTSKTGDYKVKYTYTLKSGKTIKQTIKFIVVDTTPPIVTCGEDKYTYEVDEDTKEAVNNKKNVEAIEEMVKKDVSCNEQGAVVTVTTLSADELSIGDVAVIVTATDESGNIGSCQVMCEIKVKEEKETTTHKPEPVSINMKSKKNKKKNNK